MWSTVDEIERSEDQIDHTGIGADELLACEVPRDDGECHQGHSAAKCQGHANPDPTSAAQRAVAFRAGGQELLDAGPHATPLARGAVLRGGETAQNADSGSARLLLVGRPLGEVTPVRVHAIPNVDSRDPT